VIFLEFLTVSCFLFIPYISYFGVPNEMGFKLEFGNDAHVYRVIALEFLPGMAY
jgi:hypothetical protein